MGGAAVSVAGSVAGGIISSSGAKKGAGLSQRAEQNAEAAIDAGAQNAVTRSAPYTTAGTNATNQLSDLLGISGNTTAAGYGSLGQNFTSADLPTNDGFQFQLNQGVQALQRTQAANGGLLSGAAAKAMDSYTQGLASTEYQNAFNNFNTNKQNNVSNLMGLSSQGANAQSNVNSLVSGAETQDADLRAGVAPAQVAANQVATNAETTGLGNITNSLQNYINGLSSSSSLGSNSTYSTLSDPNYGVLSGLGY